MGKQLIARITAFKNYLALELLANKSEKDASVLACDNPKCLGQMILDCKRLGVSNEAFSLLKEVKQSPDDIGDIICYMGDDKKYRFGWLGGGKRLIQVSPGNELGQFGFMCFGPKDVTIIPNDFPEEAVKFCK